MTEHIRKLTFEETLAAACEVYESELKRGIDDPLSISIRFNINHVQLLAEYCRRKQEAK